MKTQTRKAQLAAAQAPAGGKSADSADKTDNTGGDAKMPKNSRLPTNEQFRTDFPEFANKIRYPDPSVNFLSGAGRFASESGRTGISSSTWPNYSRLTIRSCADARWLLLPLVV